MTISIGWARRFTWRRNGLDRGLLVVAGGVGPWGWMGGQGKEDEEDEESEESLSKCRRVQEKQLVMLVFRSAKL